ncbi:MAG: hypothetical protein J0H74_28510 [Chitinophagaceae bacterium]|nr:hypothetical protein [Chitinophagaceae bacterium]
MKKLDKIQSEWLVVTALKELLSIVKKDPYISHMDAIKFAIEIAPTLMGNSKIGEYEKGRLKNIAEHLDRSTLAPFSKEDVKDSADLLLEQQISEIKKQLAQHIKHPDAAALSGDKAYLEDPYEKTLKKELANLSAIKDLSEKSFLNLEKITESQAILNDAFLQRPDKIWVQNQLGKFNTYINKETKTFFRVAILHPNPSEAVTGADLIYEQYDKTNENVRIAAIQYKIWENLKLYFSKNNNLRHQLEKMKDCFCMSAFCKRTPLENTPGSFKRPFCCAFIRPTNKFQESNDLVTTGYHLPVCRVDDLKTEGYKEYMLEFYKIRNASIDTEIFEELFNKEVLGSGWVEISMLENFYRETKVLEPSQKIVLYAQSIPL